MGKKDHKKDRKRDRRRSRSRSPSDTDESDRSRSRSRSRSPPTRKRKHESSSSSSSSSKHRKSSSRRHDRSRSPTPSRSRSRSRDRDRKKKKRRKRSRTPSSSDSSSTDESDRSRSPPRHRVKQESTASSSSSSSSQHDRDTLKRMKEEEKSRLRASETPEERAARKAAKKALKQASSSTMLSNIPGGGGTDQPFIWKKKYEKNIAEGVDVKILSRAELAAKQLALQDEIAAIKARKIQRAEEKEQMDALREQMQREAEMENVDGWEEKEEEFHRKTAEMRTAIRMKEGREKLVDVLAKNRTLYRQLQHGPSPSTSEDHPEYLGSTLDPNLTPAEDIELTEAWKIFVEDQVPWRDLEHLLKDIDALTGLERADEIYWRACQALARASIERQKAIAFAQPSRTTYNNNNTPLPIPIKSSAQRLKDEMALLLRGKTLAELHGLERDITSLLAGERPPALRHLTAMDQEYWAALKIELAQFKHQAYLREFHIELLELRLKDLQHYIRASESAARSKLEQARREAIERGEDPDEFDRQTAAAAASSATSSTMEVEPDKLDGLKDEKDEMVIDLNTFDSRPEPGAEDEDDGRSMSPELHPITGDADRIAALNLIDPDVDYRDLIYQRRLVSDQKQRESDERQRLAAGSAVAAAVTTTTAGLSTTPTAAAAASSGVTPSGDSDDSAFRREAARGVEGDEVQLRQDFAIPSQTYWWHDRYRPRKPRFFNRVKTGYEWNKYNSTHYDKENPPPKIVQGYKFNIFYPDLIDPSQAPRYRIEPDPGGNPDFCIIRFMAGPPYEDIAFKIVKKEWEYSFKKGYKCVFDRGVLALYFNFRRYFYRR